MACVKDLLSLDSFRPMELAAGHGGLYRPVSWPNIAQTPSIREWLIGGDVIIMTGIGLECTDEFLNSIVEQAVEKKAACLIVLLSPEHIPAIPAQTAVFAEKTLFRFLLHHGIRTLPRSWQIFPSFCCWSATGRRRSIRFWRSCCFITAAYRRKHCEASLRSSTLPGRTRRS